MTDFDIKLFEEQLKKFVVIKVSLDNTNIYDLESEGTVSNMNDMFISHSIDFDTNTITRKDALEHSIISIVSEELCEKVRRRMIMIELQK
jgi:hypothetical protein